MNCPSSLRAGLLGILVLGGLMGCSGPPPERPATACTGGLAITRYWVLQDSTESDACLATLLKLWDEGLLEPPDVERVGDLQVVGVFRWAGSCGSVNPEDIYEGHPPPSLVMTRDVSGTVNTTGLQTSLALEARFPASDDGVLPATVERVDATVEFMGGCR